MVNLLPETYHTLVRERYAAGRRVVLLSLALGLSLSSLLLVIPFVVSARTAKATVEAEIASLRKGKEPAVSPELAKEEAERIARAVVLLDARDRHADLLFDALGAIARHGVPGVRIETIRLSRPDGIELRGSARDRAALIALVARYRGNPIFSDVESPVSNLVKEKDIAFTLRLSLDVEYHGARQ